MKAKATRNVMKGGKAPKFDGSPWPKPADKSPIKEVEMLARMWVECDPNRDGDPDQIMRSEPKWKWFIPRAEASLKYFAANGYALHPVARGKA